ncbi:lamin tail domain-containing protein [Acidimicrobiales bacterium]|nr:lamin tail domain-containing protein [Acidimicrobiales bacterium]
MRRVLFILLSLAVAVLFFVLVPGLGTDSNTTAIDEPSTATPQTDNSSGSQVSSDDAVFTGSENLAAHPVAPPNARAAEVDRLADGDSFDIRWVDTGDSDEIRLFGLNAPEANACFGSEARDLLQGLTEDRELLVESIERDQYGRVLGNVWVGDVFVNVRMVEIGGALALSDGGNHAALMQDAQAFASTNTRGLWDPAFCGAGLDAEIVIIAIEANAPGQDHLNPNGEWIEIANLTTVDAVMTNWSIRDESTRHRFYFPDGFVLMSGDDVRVFSGCGDNTADSLYWCDGDPVWNNGGDTGFLVDPDGRFADSLSYSG